MTIDEVKKELKFDMAMTLFNPTTGERYEEESLEWRVNEDTYKHYMAEKKAIEYLNIYQQLKEKLENIIKDIEALKSDNNNYLASLRHEIRCNGILDNGLSNAEESFEAGYGSATEYILEKLKKYEEYKIIEKEDII